MLLVLKVMRLQCIIKANHLFCRKSALARATGGVGLSSSRARFTSCNKCHCKKTLNTIMDVF